MLPERLSWITEAFEPEGDPSVFLQIARDLEAEGNLEGAATVYDRAYGLAPEIDKIRQARAGRAGLAGHRRTRADVPLRPGRAVPHGLPRRRAGRATLAPGLAVGVLAERDAGQLGRILPPAGLAAAADWAGPSDAGAGKTRSC